MDNRIIALDHQIAGIQQNLLAGSSRPDQDQPGSSFRVIGVEP